MIWYHCPRQTSLRYASLSYQHSRLHTSECVWCLHSNHVVVMRILLVRFRHLFYNCWCIARKTWSVLERELERIGLEILHFDFALEDTAEHADARSGGGVTREVHTFNETITKWSVLDQAVFTRQLRDDSAAERQSNSFVGVEESLLLAIVGCLKLVASVCWSPEVDFLDAEIFGRVITVRRNEWAC